MPDVVSASPLTGPSTAHRRDNYPYAQLAKGTHHWFQEFREYVRGTAEAKGEAAEFPWLAIPPEAEEFSVVGCDWDSQVGILEVQLH